MQSLFRFISRCCHGLLVLFAMACGAVVLLAYASGTVRTHLLDALPAMTSRDQAPVLLAAAMCLLMVVLVAAWMELLIMRRPRPSLTFNTVEGIVSIAPVTLARFVRDVLCGCRGIAHVRVETALDGRKMDVAAWVRFTDEQSVANIAATAQRTVRQRVREVFGCDLLRDIRIEVTGVDLRAGKSRKLLDWRAEAEPALPSAPHISP